eukprot:jgi/Botrbrau1/12793/Bobra.117_1s0012.1
MALMIGLEELNVNRSSDVSTYIRLVNEIWLTNVYGFMVGAGGQPFDGVFSPSKLADQPSLLCLTCTYSCSVCVLNFVNTVPHMHACLLHR